ncbi:MAG: Crp/Fnr family transcriptional regulator, partial [bacterium]
IRAYLEHWPQASGRLLPEFIAETIELQQRLEDFVSCGVRTRLIRFLLHLSERYGSRAMDDGVLIDVGMSHQDLATSIGTSRETVTTMLNELHGEGLVDIGRRTLTLRSNASLREAVRV